MGNFVIHGGKFGRHAGRHPTREKALSTALAKSEKSGYRHVVHELEGNRIKRSWKYDGKPMKDWVGKRYDDSPYSRSPISESDEPVDEATLGGEKYRGKPNPKARSNSLKYWGKYWDHDNKAVALRKKTDPKSSRREDQHMKAAEKANDLMHKQLAKTDHVKWTESWSRHQAPLGSGERFAKLAQKVHSPALAAWIGRRKYGKKKFAALSRHEQVDEVSRELTARYLDKAPEDLKQNAQRPRRFFRWTAKGKEAFPSQASLRAGRRVKGINRALRKFGPVGESIDETVDEANHCQGYHDCIAKSERHARLAVKNPGNPEHRARAEKWRKMADVMDKIRNESVEPKENKMKKTLHQFVSECLDEVTFRHGGFGGEKGHRYDKWNRKGGVEAWKDHVRSIHGDVKFSVHDEGKMLSGTPAHQTKAHKGSKEVGSFSHYNGSSDTIHEGESDYKKLSYDEFRGKGQNRYHVSYDQGRWKGKNIHVIAKDEAGVREVMKRKKGVKIHSITHKGVVESVNEGESVRDTIDQMGRANYAKKKAGKLRKSEKDDSAGSYQKSLDRKFISFLRARAQYTNEAARGDGEFKPHPDDVNKFAKLSPAELKKRHAEGDWTTKAVVKAALRLKKESVDEAARKDQLPDIARNHASRAYYHNKKAGSSYKKYMDPKGGPGHRDDSEAHDEKTIEHGTQYNRARNLMAKAANRKLFQRRAKLRGESVDEARLGGDKHKGKENPNARGTWNSYAEKSFQHTRKRDEHGAKFNSIVNKLDKRARFGSPDEKTFTNPKTQKRWVKGWKHGKLATRHDDAAHAAEVLRSRVRNESDE